MPQFIKYLGHWYEFENHSRKGLIAVNHKGGWFDIDENNPNYMEAEMREFADWHALHLATGYDPTRQDLTANDIWISPYGSVHEGEAHAVAAEDIATIWYGWNDDEFENAEYFLEQRGWVKCSRFFWDMHLDQYGYGGWAMLPAQAQVIRQWCEIHRIEYPEDIIHIKFGVL